MNNTRPVVRWYVGGLSAGHVMPLRAYAQQQEGIRVFIVGNSPLDHALMQQAPEVNSVIHMRSMGIRRRNMMGYMRALIAGARDVGHLLVRYVRERPREIVTTGGGVALPALAIAALTRTPVRVYELNAIPGRVVALCARWGWPLYTVFPEAFTVQGYAAHVVPYPLYIRERQYTITRADARARYTLATDVMTVVVLGGSQGSAWLNTHVPALVAAAQQDLRISIQVVHQTGAQCFQVMQAYREQGIRAHVVSFEADSAWLYAAADLVICRAGSGTLHEVEHWNIPTLVVPLPERVTDHQRANAQVWCARHPERRIWSDQDGTGAQAREAFISLLRSV